MNIILADPAVEGLGSSVGSSGFNASVNRGRMFVSLKPLKERNISTQKVIARLRAKLGRIPGLRGLPEASAGATPRRPVERFANIEFTLWSSDIGAMSNGRRRSSTA